MLGSFFCAIHGQAYRSINSFEVYDASVPCRSTNGTCFGVSPRPVATTRHWLARTKRNWLWFFHDEIYMRAHVSAIYGVHNWFEEFCEPTIEAPLLDSSHHRCQRG